MAAGEKLRQGGRHESAGPRQDEQRDAAQDEGQRKRHDDRRISADRHEGADDRADARAEREHRQDAAENAERPLHCGRRHHRAEADHRADGKIDAAGEHDDGLRRRDHRGRKPALHELGQRADREDARKQNREERREYGQDEEQRAEPVVAPPLDRPIEARSLAEHQTASPAPGLSHTHGGRHDRLLGRLGVRQSGGDPALVEHHHPIAKMDELGRIGAQQDHGFAFDSHRPQGDIDLALGLDVDASGRVVQEQDRRLKWQPLGHRDLLLIAA